MRLTHNTSCISLSAMEQQPSGSSATIFPPSNQTSTSSRRTAPLEDQLLVNMQNVSIFSNDVDFASLGITNSAVNQWLPNSLGRSSTNGFTSSDTSSAPMSPISSPGLQNNNLNGFHHQQTHKFFSRNQAHTNHFRNNRANGVHQSNHSSQYQNSRFNNGAHEMVVPTSRTIRAAEEYKPGMRDLGYWLKKLRLHKYAPLFQDMSYRQLLALNNAALERMKVTNGARKKIAQSIEKLHERPALLKSLEMKLKNGSQCVRCAICSVRQLLWSPFIKYDGGSRKATTEIIDGFNVPCQMISDENLPALMYRVIESLNQMIFPLRKELLDLEDEYQLTMFHMFESVMKNESFTPNQQRRAFSMKKNARNYANPEEIRRHRMGMVSSSQCEGCHHAEVVNRERLMELQDRQIRHSRGDPIGLPTLSSCSALIDLGKSTHNARLEFNIPPFSSSQRIQKRPALNEDEEWLASTGSPKITTTPLPPLSDLIDLDAFTLPPIQDTQYWANVENIWGDKQTPSLIFPEYRRPEESMKESTSEEESAQTSSFNVLQLLSNDQTSQEFNFQKSASNSSKKANSTGSGYSSSESESSITTSPCASSISIIDDSNLMQNTRYGVNQVLYPSSFQFSNM